MFARAWGIKGGSGRDSPAAEAVNIAFDLQPFSTVNVDLTAIATTDILNVTESGLLQGIGFFVTEPNMSALHVSTLEIIVDGGSTHSIPVFNLAVTWAADGVGNWQASEGSQGNFNFDVAYAPLNIRYVVSLIVRLKVTVVGSATSALRINVLRGIAI